MIANSAVSTWSKITISGEQEQRAMSGATYLRADLDPLKALNQGQIRPAHQQEEKSGAPRKDQETIYD